MRRSFAAPSGTPAMWCSQESSTQNIPSIPCASRTKTNATGTFRRIKFADVIDDKEFRTLEEDSLGVDINTFDDTTSVPSFDGRSFQPAGYLYNGTFANKIVIIGSTEPEAKDLFPVSIAEGR